MIDDHEVDWGNDEDEQVTYCGSVGMGRATEGGEVDDVEDAVSLGGDEEEEFAAYGARSNEHHTPHADKPQTSTSKKNVTRRSASVSISPTKKETNQIQPTPPPPSPQLEISQPTPKLTHALPPKPVVSSSFRVPPSTTAASPMSMPRKERRSNGNSIKAGDEPSLSDRETRAGREGRFRDSRADESPSTHPGSSATDPQSLHQDRTKGFDDRDSQSYPRRDDDRYRSSHRHTHYSSDEEGREPNSHHAQSHNEVRFRYDDRERHYDYASGDRDVRPSARSKLSPEGESVDRSRPGYRESNDPDSRSAHLRDRDASPVRDDNSRRVPRRDDYPAYDSFDKGPRDYDDPPRRSTGTAERSRYPDPSNGRTNHAINQGPGRSSTLRRNSPSPRPRSRSPPNNRRDGRGHTPPRYPEYPPDSRPPHYRSRAESPPPRLRGPDRRDAPFDLPQRRPRGVSEAHDSDYAIKRRKMDDRDGNPSLVRRGHAGADTYPPQEISTASTSPQSTGAIDDLNRPRRREPLPPQSHRYKEASSDSGLRPPLSGSNKIMPLPQHSAPPPHRHYPPIPRDHDVFPSRHPDTDMARLDRGRSSGHDTAHHYPDKFSREDRMDVDPPYRPRAPLYEEPVRPRDLVNRTSSYHDTSRDTIPSTSRPRRQESRHAAPTIAIASAPVDLGNHRARSRDGSPRHHHEPRLTNTIPSSTSMSTMLSGPSQDIQFVEDHRHRGRHIDRDREGRSPTLPRNQTNVAAPRSRSAGRYDEPGGEHTCSRSPKLRPAPPSQEQMRHQHQPSSASISRRERQILPPPEPTEIHRPRNRGESIARHSPPQERSSRSGPPPETNFSPPSPLPPPVNMTREWTPRQPEFLLNLPPPSTRLPGAPPPPVLPTHPYGTPRDSNIHPRLRPPKDEKVSAKPESDTVREPLQDRDRQQPPSPMRQQIKDEAVSRAYQTQDDRYDQTQAPSLGISISPGAPAGDGRRENSNSREDRQIPNSNSTEGRWLKPPADDRQTTTPASWDRPRDTGPKPLTLPPSLPPKPVAALGDLTQIQQSTSSRAGHQSRGRRNQHDERWEPAPRSGGGKDKERERNRGGSVSEYRGPSLLARMSSSDSIGRDVETYERESGEIQRKRSRMKRYQGV
ncbi:hypothetical protein B0F90DRAFT_1754609 [Multifurca ochricompacta]|uniref:Uncharacterized protein n=1 Tax=Multifurca ochricompacta TaxID=376703 RepID=A0AAD4LY87_9AGAM|nr:hypothetical protein B0F90DRAFT_1754609 [Multifurca ochricompacta]